MKAAFGIFIGIVILGGVVLYLNRAEDEVPENLPPNAFLVSVRACDVETAQVLSFGINTEIMGSNVPIQQIALHNFTLATFCQWADWTTRTFTVESTGYESRSYTVTGKNNIIAVLHRAE